ncbi:hypothetical protein ACFLY6_00655 [Candidatus Dependentiae bacterium]
MLGFEFRRRFWLIPFLALCCYNDVFSAEKKDSKKDFSKKEVKEYKRIAECEYVKLVVLCAEIDRIGNGKEFRRFMRNSFVMKELARRSVKDLPQLSEENTLEILRFFKDSSFKLMEEALKQGDEDLKSAVSLSCRTLMSKINEFAEYKAFVEPHEVSQNRCCILL